MIRAGGPPARPRGPTATGALTRTGADRPVLQARRAGAAQCPAERVLVNRCGGLMSSLTWTSLEWSCAGTSRASIRDAGHGSAGGHHACSSVARTTRRPDRRRARPDDQRSDRRDRAGDVERAVRFRPPPVRGDGAVHDAGRHPRSRADGHRRSGRLGASPNLAVGDRVVVPFNISCGALLHVRPRSAIAVRDDPGSRPGLRRRAVRLHQAVRPGAGRAGRAAAGSARRLRPDRGSRRPAR